VFPFETIFRTLNDSSVRYVVVGGVAVVLHGVMRFTADLDIVIDLAPEEAKRAMDALTAAGFAPSLPVPAADFADAAKRRQWIDERNMLVFSMVDRSIPPNSVDLFAESPIDFAALWSQATIMQLDTTSVRVASIADLIAMKRFSARPKDLLDIDELEKIRGS
jgi:hypothetical protein